MLVKVCGMRDEQNALDVAALGVDMMGFIFYDKSPRFVGEVAPSTPNGVKRVGVFVNYPIGYILDSVSRHNLDFVQLHGAESVALCRELKAHDIGVIKAISISTKEDILATEAYDGEVDYFVFDTKCKGYGGSGERFDWSILDAYSGSTPFLLSGGLDLDSVDEIRNITHKSFAGVDLNSRFEVSPALKNIDKLREFIEKYNNVMNRIDNLFAQKSHDILSVYYPAGYPYLDDTMMVLSELQTSGIDMVELGIPFSDPMADGVVIQQAATTALENGMSLKYLFSQIEKMRETITIPVILMGYLNPIMHYGFEKFCEDCKRVGVDGMIIPDLPFREYISEYKVIADRYDLNVVMFISPETSAERVRLIDDNTKGFIYMVSSAGTTGARSSFDGESDGYFERIDSMKLKNPRMIGFGISSKETFRAACKASNGAIIGSHFVKLMKSEPSAKAAIEKLRIDMGI